MTGFDDWKREVDKELLKQCSLTSDDLPDFDYWLAYEEHKSPAATARAAIRAAKEY